MRLDFFLNKVCIVNSRNTAKKICQNDSIKINEKKAKASSILKAEDLIEIFIYNYKYLIKVLQIPVSNVKKQDAMQYYQILSKEKINYEP